MRLLRYLFPVLVFTLIVNPGRAAGDESAAPRLRMVETIRAIADSIGPVSGKSQIGEDVIEVMKHVPRHLFIPEDQRAHAYRNRPLPIGFGQTISQPYIVALMTDLLELKGGETVLEVGTGSGYQAAILGKMTSKVLTIEIVPELARRAGNVLKQLGFSNVVSRQGDGYHGWEEHAPFDAVIVTAAASHVPPPLLKQLKPGGRMIIPVGNPFLVQQLILIEKAHDGSILTRHLLPVRFVPLTGGNK
jgi:protein-L-isoaspartate(D-aspartate) O-methyltransferase